MSPALPLNSLDAIEAAALALLDACRAARGTVARPVTPAPGLSVVEVCNEFLNAKARAGRSDNYLRVTHCQLSAFAKERATNALASVSAMEIETWLFKHEWNPTTRRNHLLTLRNLFGFAVDRSYLVKNPALAVDLPDRPNLPAEIHTPDQVAAALEMARGLDVNLCRWLAVRYFAGLRGSEAASLDESQIHPGRGIIEVTAAKAKTRKRRIVQIQPALAAWLALGGVLPLRDVNTRLWDLTRALPFPWPRNVTRHSFCSYHLAEFQNAGKTALEAGHSEAMLFNHYREVVSQEAASLFWQIRPNSLPG